MKEPNGYTVSQYEDGWFVEKPDPDAPLEDCRFIQVAGPFDTMADAKVFERAIRKADKKGISVTVTRERG